MIDVNTMSVMIVDDMENMTKSIRGMMKVLKYGKNFHFAKHGREALSLLKKNPVDLLITDWNMPVMNGVELLGAIREDREFRDLPVIMVTAEANREIVAEAAESDIDSYILKPLTVKSLQDRILSVVDKANNPPPMVFHLKQARDHEDKGDLDAAIEEAKLAMAADATTTKPLRELGYLYFKKDDLENAEKYLLKAAKMNEIDVIAFHRLAKLYLKRNDIENASIYFNKAMDISPRHVSRGVHFGKILVQKGQVKKAISVFDKAISLSDDALAQSEEIADFCMSNAIYNYAASLMESILLKNHLRYDIMCKLGVACECLGEYQKAIKYFSEAEKKNKQDLNIKMHLAKSYMALGKVFQAEEKLNFIVKADPENEEAKELLKKNV